MTSLVAMTSVVMTSVMMSIGGKNINGADGGADGGGDVCRGSSFGDDISGDDDVISDDISGDDDVISGKDVSSNGISGAEISSP